MAVRVPSAQEVGAKWASVTPSRAGDYTKGVQGAGPAWQDGVNGAEDTWAAGVQEAAASGRWGRSVQGRGGFYAQQASQLGAPRWSAGVTAARDRYTSSMTPVLSTIQGVTLPPRLPAGSPGNMERSRIIGAALHAMKIGS